MDSCGNTGPYTTLPHNTVYLSTAINRCAPNIGLNWNAYINWTGGVSGYNILVSTNSGPFILVQTLTGSVTNYTYSGFTDGDSVCCYVQAVSTNPLITSESNIICNVVNVVQPPLITYLSNVSVTGRNQTSIKWLVDSLADLMTYRIDRSADGINYNTIFNQVAPSVLNTYHTYIDNAASTVFSSSYYKIVVNDSCNQEFYSNIGQTIFLEVDANYDFTNSLNWIPYTDWLEPIQSYNIYRKDVNTWNFLASVGPGILSYTDDVTTVNDEDGAFCYQVAAIEAYNQLDVDYKITDTTKSLSNEVCVIQYPSIYVPNAFVPDGLNSVFKPEMLYVDNTDYSFSIFNRWGEKIFETNDINVGWDGTLRNKPMPQGTYVYFIDFTNTNGTTYHKKGSVLLIR